APPNYVQDPACDQRVVNEKSAAPVESGYFSGLANCFTVSRRMAPVVIEVEGAPHVRKKADAPNGPGRPRHDIPSPPSARKQIERSPNRVPGQRQPDCYSRQKFAPGHS